MFFYSYAVELLDFGAVFVVAAAVDLAVSVAGLFCFVRFYFVLQAMAEIQAQVRFSKTVALS